MKPSIIIACAAIVLVAVLGATPAAADNSLAIGPDRGTALSQQLAGASAHVCAFAGASSRECAIASNLRPRWFSPSTNGAGFEAMGRFDPNGRLIWLADSFATQASLGAFEIHEISHQIDAEQGRCCWPSQCMGTERHAYAEEFAMWRWIYATWGQPLAGFADPSTSWLNMYLWGDLTERVEQMARASCSAN